MTVHGDDQGPDEPIEIRFWDHARYGLVNRQMLKALVEAAKKIGRAT